MKPMKFITTKRASEILNISTALLSFYAQHMEYIGYKFNTIHLKNKISKDISYFLIR